MRAERSAGNEEKKWGTKTQHKMKMSKWGEISAGKKKGKSGMDQKEMEKSKWGTQHAWNEEE